MRSSSSSSSSSSVGACTQRATVQRQVDRTAAESRASRPRNSTSISPSSSLSAAAATTATNGLGSGRLDSADADEPGLGRLDSADADEPGLGRLDSAETSEGTGQLVAANTSVLREARLSSPAALAISGRLGVGCGDGSGEDGCGREESDASTTASAGRSSPSACCEPALAAAGLTSVTPSSWLDEASAPLLAILLQPELALATSAVAASAVLAAHADAAASALCVSKADAVPRSVTVSASACVSALTVASVYTS
eukprot:CAMPEP_0115857548 /NCGR_PEP_ID=MMETSP0287-20121206/15631_1 /TAXON_ID=412157 /ORGANISM="Chrysochromulina rotalis, Strain UIO044" /LENGTH=254 /DNA_ID=CAMNT_0003311769 /DNA_START=314 /DNA_END=1074 /DNA_ORIENTATION=+